MKQEYPVDPFFEQLRADIQEGRDDIARGEWVSAAELWRDLDAEIARLLRPTEPGS